MTKILNAPWKQLRSVIRPVRWTPDEWKAIAAAARKARMTESEYVRYWVLTVAQAEPAQQP